jgi:hypothetical protein
MMNWDEQGCEICRKAWESGVSEKKLTSLGEFINKHARLYRCETCHAIWEELERFSHVITRHEAKTQYPEVEL